MCLSYVRAVDLDQITRALKQDVFVKHKRQRSSRAILNYFYLRRFSGTHV